MNEPINLNEQEQATLQDIKNELINEVKTELANKGYEIIPQGYEGQKDLVKLVDRANQLKVAYDQECERIKNRYKEDIAQKKIDVLTVDYNLDKQDLLAEVDQVLVKDQKYRADSIEQLQKSDEYKVQRKETLETMALLKQAGVNEIPTDVFLDLIGNVVEAKDSKTLSLIGLMAGKGMNEVIIEQVQHNIALYQQNNELVNFANSAKKFISTGKDDFTLFAFMKNYS